MARSKRGNVIRRHEQAVNLLETAIGYIEWLHEKALPHHPDYAEGYWNIIMILTQAIDFIESMKKFI